MTSPCRTARSSPENRILEPASGHQWYGSADLWTSLDSLGAQWQIQSDGSTGLVHQTLWWSEHYDLSYGGTEPDIVVTARSLDGGGNAEAAALPTNAWTARGGLSMLVALELPTGGCWHVTGTYEGHTLSYVVWVAEVV